MSKMCLVHLSLKFAHDTVEVTFIFVNDFSLFYFTVYLHLPLNIFSFPRNNNCLFVMRNFMDNIVVHKI